MNVLCTLILAHGALPPLFVDDPKKEDNLEFEDDPENKDNLKY